MCTSGVSVFSIFIEVTLILLLCSSPLIHSASSISSRNVVILGSGPAGCTSAIYAGRALLDPLVISGYMPGGQLTLTNDVENFPGGPVATPGPALMDSLIQQAKTFGAEFWQTACEKVDFDSYPYKIHLPNCTVTTKAVIIATGAESIWLGAENEEEFKGYGISTCAVCDGALFKEKDVVVIGGGDSAMEEALFLSRYANSVMVFNRSKKLKASKLLLERALANKKINILKNRIVSRWRGSNHVLNGVDVRNVEDGTTEEVFCDGGFIAIGHKPNTEFLDNQILLDADGYIKTTENCLTSKPGVFACGDVVDKKQAITAAGMGCQAALDAEKWLENNR